MAELVPGSYALIMVVLAQPPAGGVAAISVGTFADKEACSKALELSATAPAGPRRRDRGDIAPGPAAGVEFYCVVPNVRRQ